MERVKRVLVMAGGTGGHVFPALAVANYLRQQGIKIEWLGTRLGIEAEVVPAQGIILHTIDVTGIRGKGFATKLKAPLLVVRALLQAISQVRAIKPDAVLGLGGFASGPGGVAARILRIPLVIHEQNAVAGTTNRILSRIATRVLEAFPGALPKGEHTGNPVREDIACLPVPEQRGVGSHRPPRLLVLGGSLGAMAINKIVPEALARIAEDKRPQVRHQCGQKHSTLTLKSYDSFGVKASVEPFIADMAEAYGWADFVICRSGALTVSELSAVGLGALLIPFPAAIDDHQTRNGEWLVKQGAAMLIQQVDLSVQRLVEELESVLADPQRLIAMANNSRGLARPQATQVVAAVCEEVMV